MELISIASRLSSTESSPEPSPEPSPGRPATSPPRGPKSNERSLPSSSFTTTKKWQIPELLREFRTAAGRRL